jgi:peptidoglycan biosynthesis protein MviN/MurJ (putative lipid II flippase)
LVGSAVSTAAFPRLNARLSAGRPDLFRRDFLMVLRALIWIAAPLVVVAFFGRGYLSRMIYAQGNQQIATIFGFLSLAIFFRILYSIISRWFYAQKDTRTPLYVSLFTIALNIFLAYHLAKPSAYGIYGLALSQSIVVTLEVFILTTIMMLRDHKLFDAYFWNGVVKIFSVTGFTIIVAYTLFHMFPLNALDRGFLALGGKLIIMSAITFSVHIAVSSLFGLEEVRPFLSRVKQIALKPIKLQDR